MSEQKEVKKTDFLGLVDKLWETHIKLAALVGVIRWTDDISDPKHIANALWVVEDVIDQQRDVCEQMLEAHKSKTIVDAT